MGEVGERLRQARQALGMSLEQAEEITRIRRRFLQALEEEDYGQLPGDPFVRGFLRNYALALGLNAEEILAAAGFKPSTPPIEPLRPMRPPAMLDEPLLPPPGRHRALAVLFGLMLIVAVGVVAWQVYRYLEPARTVPTLPPTSQDTPVPTVSQVAPTAQPTATRQPTATTQPVVGEIEVPANGVLLRVEATQAAWLRVMLDERLAYEGTLNSGQIREWSGQQQVTIRCGNAGGIRVWFNGEEQPALGEVGQVVEITWRAAPLPTPGEEETAVAQTAEPVGPPPGTATPTPTPAETATEELTPAQ